MAGNHHRVLAQNTVRDTWNYASNGNELDPAQYAFPVVDAKSEWVYAAVENDVPAAPSGLTANAVSSSQVDLAWTDNASNEDGFVVERSNDLGVTWNQIGLPTAANVTTFSDTSVLPLGTYQYQVCAFNGSGDSLPSNVAEVTTPDLPPAAPTDLVATVISSAQVDLAWTDASNNEDGFRIERSDDGGTTWNQIGLPTAADVTTFSDTSVLPLSTYQCQVYASNASGNSAPSNVLDVSTPDVPPAAPSNLVITNQTASSLTLAWTDNSNDESGFTVQIATDKNFSPSLQSINVGADVTVYMFFPLAPNTKYYMRVAAFNGAGSSAWSPTLIDKLVKCCIIFTWPNAHFN